MASLPLLALFRTIMVSPTKSHLLNESASLIRKPLTQHNFNSTLNFGASAPRSWWYSSLVRILAWPCLLVFMALVATGSSYRIQCIHSMLLFYPLDTSMDTLNAYSLVLWDKFCVMFLLFWACSNLSLSKYAFKSKEPPVLPTLMVLGETEKRDLPYPIFISTPL